MTNNIDSLRDEALEVAIRAAKIAGARAAEIRSDSAFTVSFKGTRDLVTEADLQCEQIVVDEIRKAFPDHQILSEETSPKFLPEMETGPLWVIDPIDGTTNFAHGQVHVGVSIGFVFDGKREAAAVNCPFLNELYTAKRNQGAFCNEKPIQASAASLPEEAIICTGFPYQRTHLDGVLRRFSNVLRKYRDMRRLGAASVDLCWTAAGKIDGFYEDICPWDVAAGLLIASEAGCYLGKFNEPPSPLQAWPESEGSVPDEIDGTNIVVCAPKIAEDLVATLNAD